MPVLAVVALMGFMFLPGSAGAPAYAETVSAPVIASAPEAPKETPKLLATSKEVAQTYLVRLTAYNAVPGQTDDTPFVTASGLYSNPEIVVARSRDLAEEMPFGTVIRIERAQADTPSCRFSEVEHLIGYRVVGDVMHQRWTSKIDVLLDHTDTVTLSDGRTLNPARVLGVCGDVTVTVVGKLKLSEVPDTQEELRAMFEEPTLALR